MEIRIPVSAAELLDKVSILEIKMEKIHEPEKKTNIERELTMLKKICDTHIEMTPDLQTLWDSLRATNRRGWDIEDRKRECERAGDFSEAFIEAARAAFKNNDGRAMIWKEINLLLGSDIVQEKSYPHV